MQKQLALVITAAAVLLAAIASVALYTVHIANAQSNMTSAGGAKNMTTGSNMTGAAGNTTGGAHGSSIPTTNPAGAKFSPPCPNFFPDRPGGVPVCH